MWGLNRSSCVRICVCVIQENSLPFMYIMLNLRRDSTGNRKNLNVMKLSIRLCLL